MEWRREFTEEHSGLRPYLVLSEFVLVEISAPTSASWSWRASAASAMTRMGTSISLTICGSTLVDRDVKQQAFSKWR